MHLASVRFLYTEWMERYVELYGSQEGLPVVSPFLFEHHVGLYSQLSHVFPKMVRILQNEFHWLVSSESAYSVVEPIFGGNVEADICVSFDFDGEWGGRDHGGSGNIAAGEAAIDDYVGGELYIGSVGVPSWYFFIFG